MKRKLLDTVFLSEKRKRILLLLDRSPRSIDGIVDRLETSRQGLLPQIKILIEEKLVEKKNGDIQLTNVGKLLINDIKKIVSNVDVLEIDYDFWTTRDFSAIPEHLFNRLGDIYPCQIRKPEINEMFELDSDILKGMYTSKYVAACASFIHPSYPSVFQELNKSGTDTSVLLTENAIQKLETEFKEGYDLFLQSENSEICALEELKIPAIVVTDNFILLWLFNEKGNFEPKHIVSTAESAINWGKEFVDHYKKDASEVTGIMYSN